jgi:hypothetical protein
MENKVREKELPITTTKREFYRAFVELLQPFHKLRKRDADVFGEILYQAYLIQDVEDKYRFKLLFDYDTRIEIESYLNISSSILRNSICSLRKKNLILSGNRIPKHYLFDPGLEFDLKFKFKIEESAPQGT